MTTTTTWLVDADSAEQAAERWEDDPQGFNGDVEFDYCELTSVEELAPATAS